MMIYPAFYKVVYKIHGEFSFFTTEFLSVAQNYFWHCAFSGCDYVCLKAVNLDDTMSIGLMAHYKDKEEGDSDV